MTVAELIKALEGHDPSLPVGILYDGQLGFYPVFEVRESREEQIFLWKDGVRKGTAYVCVCDKP